MTTYMTTYRIKTGGVGNGDLANQMFGPEALHTIDQVFDSAWLDIAGNWGDDDERTEAARTLLAKSILSVARDDSRDVEVLKSAALYVMRAQKIERGLS